MRASPPGLPSSASDDPLSLPARPATPERPPVPWLASAVPVVGALGFWAVTGSVLALWFALLGPVIATAALVDGARAGRRRRREAERAAEAARAEVRARVVARHAAEREALCARHPDVAGVLARREQIWRPVPDREGVVAIGRGVVDSAVRVVLPAGDPDARDREIAGQARVLHDAPVLVPWDAGIAVVGPAGSARAVVRALVLQLALLVPPGRLEVVGGRETWMGGLPHAAVRGERCVVVGSAEDATAEADLVLLDARPGEPLPARCGVVLTLTAIDRAHAELGAHAGEVVVEQVGLAQAEEIALELTERARSAFPRSDPDETAPDLGPLLASERRRSRSSLPVAVGVAAGRAVELDLVRDGPHAVVTGMTGAGKSELLVTWVLALCAAYRTADVAFLLADFKGGTAFDALAGLPHVTGVITDLDTRVARRAIESLRAEIRRREAVLARAGAREVADVELPRLIVVVDEFAALRDAAPELESLFADIAARGRALGLHLILGTQRAAGALRDGLLANCPLRIALRVADRSDSRAVIGTDEAADLPGGDEGRGRALVRRAGDARPGPMRVALSAPDDVATAARDAGDAPRPAWLPELPAEVPLDALADGEPGDGSGLVLGLADDPERQRQFPWVLPEHERGLVVVGGPRAGTTTALRTLAAQVPPERRRWIGHDPEEAWDALVAALDAPPGTTVLVDDLDVVLSRLPDEHARAAGDLLERLAREAGARRLRIVVGAHRLSAAAARVADLLPWRLVLATASRADHIAAGGDAAGYAPGAVAGRGAIDGLAIQVAVAATAEIAPVAAVAPRWDPPAGLSGVVTPRPLAVLARWERSGVRVRSVEDHLADTPADGGDDDRVVLVGAPAQWLARPRALERLRAADALVVDAACERDLRLLTGDRALAPYADPARGRGWAVGAGHPPRRVTLDPVPEP